MGEIRELDLGSDDSYLASIAIPFVQSKLHSSDYKPIQQIPTGSLDDRSAAQPEHTTPHTKGADITIIQSNTANTRTISWTTM
jgi:hypothetical protein